MSFVCFPVSYIYPFTVRCITFGSRSSISLLFCPAFPGSMITMCLRMFFLQLAQRRHESPTCTYLHLGFSRFLYYYARGHYADAGVWSRRLAEAFCINALHRKYAAAGTSHVSTYPLLGRMVSDLPYSISWSRVYDLCEEGKDTAT